MGCQTSCERVYVQKEVKEAFTKILLEKMAAVKVGDPCQDDTVDMGPLVEARALESVSEKVERAIKQGAKLLRSRPIQKPSLCLSCQGNPCPYFFPIHCIKLPCFDCRNNSALI